MLSSETTGAALLKAGILDQISTCVVAADDRRRVSFANDNALATFGLSAVECVGRSVLEVFEGNPGLRDALDALQHGQERRLEIALQRSDGSRVDVGLTVVRGGGTLAQVAYILVFRDIEERRLLESELQRVERLGALGQLVAGLAHALRNPIAGARGLSEALLYELPQADRHREYVTRIHAQLERMENLVRAAVRLGDPSPPNRRRHSLTAVLESTNALLRPRLGTSSLRAELPAGLPDAYVDRGQIAEALHLVVDNALDAADRPDLVTLRGSVEPALDPPGGRWVRLDVRNDGSVIPDALLSRIFDPFFSTKPKGVGLGLTLAQTLVVENEGRLLVRSAADTGTVFSLLLPEAVG